MDGYDPSTYGDRFADVYDDWYGSADDTEAAVDRVAKLAAGGAVLELGVGTGRLALPLAERRLAVTGIDASDAMVARLRAKPGADAVRVVVGDMAGPLPAGPYAVVLVARNTFFNLTTDDAQRRCLAEVTQVLAADGRLVLEAFVPHDGSGPRSAVEVREIAADRVVLFVDRADPVTQEAWSSFVEMTPSGNRFRPCHVKYCRPDQLDGMAIQAGLALDQRWATWDGAPFDDDSPAHVSVYRHA